MPQSASFVKKRAKKLYKFTFLMKYIHYNDDHIKKIIYTVYIYLTFGAFIAYWVMAMIAIN